MAINSLSLTVARHAKGHENPASLRKSPPIHHSNDRTWLQKHHVLCCSGDAHQRAQSSRQGEEAQERMGFLQDSPGSSRCDFSFIALARVIMKKSNCFRRAASLRVRPSPALDIYYVFNFAGASRTHPSPANWAFASDSRSNENFYAIANQEPTMNSKSRMNFQRHTCVSITLE
jgi:hypothetical protein